MPNNAKKGRKRIRLLVAMMMFSVFFLSSTFVLLRAVRAAEECVSTNATEPPKGEIVLKSPFKTKKPPVTFNHEKHVADGIACTECHHVYENGENVWHKGDVVQPCCICHKEKTEGKVLSLQNAFHKNCRDCHKDLEKEGKTTGPYKKCTDCHKKD